MSPDTIAATDGRYNVGGVMLDRPFQIRRLGHFGLYALDLEACLAFYRDLLGFRISDTLDFAKRAPSPDVLAGLGDTKGYFMRYGTDHHAFVLFPWRVRKALDTRGALVDGVMTNQITWQVGSLREVVSAVDWFNDHQVRVMRSGRDTPGSNWHAYPMDPDGHVNELYYGIEQIGWNGHSKPPVVHMNEFNESPALPQMAEIDEVDRAIEAGIDLTAGYRAREAREPVYDVGGILLPRPFKIVRIGPVRLFVKDMDRALAYYRDEMGFTSTESVTWEGHTCHFLRANTEHHSLALYPIALRARLGMTEHSSCMSFGVQVNDYQQLRDAIRFLGENGVEIRYLPPELSPGIDYSAYAIDPDGHAVQLYYSMEQIGWDGRPRPAAERRPVDNDNWPETVEPTADTFRGETFLGPWG